MHETTQKAGIKDHLMIHETAEEMSQRCAEIITEELRAKPSLLQRVAFAYGHEIADHRGMKPYSLDLRQRVVHAVEQDHCTIEETAEMFSVGKTFIKQMLRQWRQTGNLEPKPHGGGANPGLHKQHLAALAKQVAKEPDARLADLQQHLKEAAQVEVSVSTICRALQQLNLPLKKRV